MRVSAVFIREFAPAHGVEEAGVLLEVMREFTFAPNWAVIIIVHLLASFLGRLWPGDLPPDIVGEVTIKAVLAVASEVVNAWVVALSHMHFVASAALFNSEVLPRTELLDHA